MNKIKSLTQLLVSSYLIRLLITGASIGDALVIISLSSLYGLFLYLDNKKQPEANKDLKDRIIAVEEMVQKANSKVSALQLRR